MEKKYLFRDYYNLNSFMYFEMKIPIIINFHDSTFKTSAKFIDYFSKKVFKINKEYKNEIQVLFLYDPSITNDGYFLDVNKSRIQIKSRNERGILYAIEALNSLVEERNKMIALPIVQIADYPSFEMRGIIEGYYGKPWSFEERMDMFSFMSDQRLNTYIYAPKNDQYHRDKWCDFYPEEEINKLAILVKKAKDYSIDFWYTISPGYIKVGKYAFDYNKEDNFKRLFKKINQLLSIGIYNFGILLDDIDYELNDENKKRFKSPGIAHAYICNRLYAYIKSQNDGAKFVMCPTEYHQIGETTYRKDLRKNLNEDIYVFFTGNRVCAEAITESDLSLTKAAYNKKLFIWDNFPVSDFKHGVREFIAPITNRSSKMGSYASGYFINPSIHYNISKVAIMTMADYSWNAEKYDSQSAFEKALKTISKKFYEKGLDFIKFNYPSILSYGDIEKHRFLVANRKDKEIKDIYIRLKKSALELLKLKLPIIEELQPWLKHAIKEADIASSIIDKVINKETILLFLDDKHFLGSEIFDDLLKREGILTEDEFNQLITKRRGAPWYRVFEEER